MKKVTSIILGIVLVAAGVIFALNAFNVTDIDVFFDGWWTLFIIIPCTVGLFTEREKFGNIIGIIIGVLLLLCSQEILDFSILWKLLVPAIIVIIGLKLIFKAVFGKKANGIIKKMKSEGKKVNRGFAAFSGSDMKCDGEVFEGAEHCAVFGGIELDLRKAIIEKDCAIQAVAIFGGIDILVPDNVNVKLDSNSVFGGASNETASIPDAPTIYVSGTAIFGGIEIK